MYSRKDKNFPSIVAINGSGHFVATNSVRELFLDFHECRGVRNWEEGGGGGGMVDQCGLALRTSSSLSEKPKVLASQIRV